MMVSDREEYSELLGSSPAMRSVFDMIRGVADTPATVLITGEPGTGKELVARTLHRLSRRSEKSFVSVNCGAFSESQFDSELFGHVKGAFAGAATNRRGMFESASEGTIFLAEVGELAPGTQERLLSALQGEVSRVGTNAPLHVDVRIVAATSDDLAEAVKSGRFREDLYLRLNVIRIHLPPLRDRVSDIPALTQHIIKRTAARMQRDVRDISSAAQARICALPLKGNMRELEFWIGRAIALCRTTIIEECDVK